MPLSLSRSSRSHQTLQKKPTPSSTSVCITGHRLIYIQLAVLTKPRTQPQVAAHITPQRNLLFPLGNHAKSDPMPLTSPRGLLRSTRYSPHSHKRNRKRALFVSLSAFFSLYTFVCIRPALSSLSLPVSLDCSNDRYSIGLLRIDCVRYFAEFRG